MGAPLFVRRPAAVAALVISAVVGSTLGLGPASAPAAAAPSVASRFEPVDPARVLDTRQTGAKVAAGASVAVPLAGRGPAGATAVVLNVTVTDPEGDGYITAYGGTTVPATSNANTDETGETAANLVVVSLAGSGAVSVFASMRTHLVVDLLGWFVPATGSTAGRFRAVDPAGARVLDTRSAGAPSSFVAGRRLVVAGQAGVPASRVRAVALNITVTEPAGAGWLQVVPTGGTTAPGASSNVNVSRAGQTVANLALVPVGADGSVTLAGNLTGHVLVDVAGWFTDATAAAGTDGLFVAVDPVRVADSRSGGALAAGATLPVSVAGAGVDAARIGAALANLTVTAATGPGFVTGWPGTGAVPVASMINADKAGATVANAGIVATNGPSFGLFTSAGAHLVVDLLGWFTATAGGPGPDGAGSVVASAAAPGGGVKIRYRSIGAAGTMTEQVTLAYLPSGPAPAGGWPIMALLHGPYGMGDQCAVSTAAGRPDEVVPWLQAGYAVVFPDLEGIGVDSPGEHPYLHGPGTGRSMLDAVRAARHVYGATVSNKVVTWGFSSGAHGSLWVGEMAEEYAPELDVRGVVSLDPVSVLSWQMNGAWMVPGFSVWWVQGQHAGNPALAYTDVLRPEAIARLPQLNAGCLDDTYGIFDDIAGGPLHTNPMTLPAWRAAFEASDPGSRHSPPVFLAGGNDFTAAIPAYPHDQHQHYIDRACALGTSVRFQIFPGGHMGMQAPEVLAASIAWLDQQVRGPQQTGCTTVGG